MVHQLTEGDTDRRTEFCKTMTENITMHTNYHENISFNDKYTFFTNRSVYRKHYCYWDDQPSRFPGNSHSNPEMNNVWSGILGHHSAGPLFIEQK